MTSQDQVARKVAPKREAGWGKLHHGTHAREGDGLRTTGRVIRHRQYPRSCSALRRLERHVDRAARSGAEA